MTETIPVSSETENAFRDWTEEIRAARTRRRKLLIGGNAGGTIATLGLIGGYFNKADSLKVGMAAPLPIFVWVVLVIFVVGLLAAWLAMESDSQAFVGDRSAKLGAHAIKEMEKRVELYDLVEYNKAVTVIENDLHDANTQILKHNKLEKQCLFLSTVLLTFGVSGATLYLFLLTPLGRSLFLWALSAFGIGVS